MKKSVKKIEQFFATSIYYQSLFSAEKTRRFNQDLVAESHRIRQMDTAGQKWCKKNYPGGYTSYNSIPNLHQRSSSFIELEKIIRKHVYAYAKELRFDLQDRPLVMSDFWLNIMPERTTHGLHLHPLSVISGTYYVQTPKGCSSIQFEDPRLGFFMASPPRLPDDSGKQGTFVDYPAEAGRLVLFESWLRHQVAANPTKQERISVSFNYAWG